MNFTNWDEVPLILTPKDVIGMGVKKTKTYEWFHNPNFPLIKQGRALYAEKTAFKKWLERESGNDTKNEMTRFNSKPSQRH